MFLDRLWRGLSLSLSYVLTLLLYLQILVLFSHGSPLFSSVYRKTLWKERCWPAHYHKARPSLVIVSADLKLETATRVERVVFQLEVTLCLRMGSPCCTPLKVSTSEHVLVSRQKTKSVCQGVCGAELPRDRSECGWRRWWVSVWMEEMGQCTGGEMPPCLKALAQQSWRHASDPQNMTRKLEVVAHICNPSTPTKAIRELAESAQHSSRNKRPYLNNGRENTNDPKLAFWNEPCQYEPNSYWQSCWLSQLKVLSPFHWWPDKSGLESPQSLFLPKLRNTEVLRINPQTPSSTSKLDEVRVTLKCSFLKEHSNSFRHNRPIIFYLHFSGYFNFNYFG